MFLHMIQHFKNYDPPLDPESVSVSHLSFMITDKSGKQILLDLREANSGNSRMSEI